MTQVPLGDASPFLQLFFLLVLTQPAPDHTLPPLAILDTLCPSLTPWLFLGWDREGQLHPGFSDVDCLATPRCKSGASI